MRRLKLPFLVAAIFRALLPIAERDEVLADLRGRVLQPGRSRTGCRRRARWAWRQAVGSVPALFRRGWWRGMTGFEPRANRMRPGGPMFESWIMDLRYAARRLHAPSDLRAARRPDAGARRRRHRRDLQRRPHAPARAAADRARRARSACCGSTVSWNEAEFLHLRPGFPGFAADGAPTARTT